MGRRWLLGLALLAAGCTVKGQGKSATPAWKMFQVEHARAVSSAPIRSGSIEWRASKAFVEENKTAISASHWVARIRGSVVSSEDLPLSALSQAFTVIGKSGKVYDAHVSTVGPGRRTWQHQEHTGKPTHLPANVPGELEVFVQVGDDKGYDDLAAYTFKGARAQLGQ